MAVGTALGLRRQQSAAGAQATVFGSQTIYVPQGFLGLSQVAGTNGVPVILQLGADPMQYQGNGYAGTLDINNDVKDVVRLALSGEGTGPLQGPLPGTIS